MNEVAPPAAAPSAPPRTMPVLSVNVKLNTEFAQRVYKRCFDRLKGDLYVLTVRTHAGGMDEAAQAIETILTETFASVRKDLDSEMERSDVLLDSVKLNELADYEGVTSIKATYSTPRAKEFLDLLIKMDQLLMRYDALWLTGNIESRQRWTRCQNWQRRLTKVANRLRELGNRTRSGLTREAEKRATGTPAAAADHGAPEPTASDTASAEERSAEMSTERLEIEADGPEDASDAMDTTEDDDADERSEALEDSRNETADEFEESTLPHERSDADGSTLAQSVSDRQNPGVKASPVRRRRVAAQASG
ncbi:hypothetical protein [Steroidobacter sp.]|uniref:hypothetical protein n=1 Tax=Steroidobacter sp. TaxID=1978227 RepID=UPI001A3BBAD8|nr:hypothetical protein [Steroidobacter sp.]MBL8265844.1 hypothetical protein [Steroidobacter sp.]